MAATAAGDEAAAAHWMSISELTAAYRAKRLTPLAVVEALFRRIEQTEPRLNAWVLLTRSLSYSLAL